jgi:hypothetical protein
MEESFSPLQDLIAKRLVQAGSGTEKEESERARQMAKPKRREKATTSISAATPAPSVASSSTDSPSEASSSDTTRREMTATATETETETALIEPDFVRMEKNIATFGFFTPSSKRIKNAPKIIRFTQTIDGNRVEAEVKISPNIEYGIPITADQDKYLAFQKIIERHKRETGKVENPVTFTTAELIKLLGQSDAGLNFKEVYEWLDLMQGTQIKSQGAVWVAGKKRFATDVFNLFSRVKRVGDELDDGTVADKNYVWLSDWYLENLNAHYLLPVDFENYKKLKNNIAKALIPLLQIWLYASRESGAFEKRYSEICQVLNIKIYQYASDIKRFFGRSLDELVANGYLAGWEITKTADEKDFKIVLRHGHKFYADRRAIKEVSNRKPKKGDNSPAEPRKEENRTEIPKREKDAPERANFASEAISGGNPEPILTGNLPSAMTSEHLEAIRQLHIEYQVSYEKAVRLACENLAETLKQLEAFPFREMEPKNKAGFLIEAIEQKYSLPENYYARLREREAAAERARRQAEIEACRLCDERGWRNVKSEMDIHFGVMHQCTHDPEIEAQLEDHVL